MKPAKKIAVFRYLLFSAFALLLFTIAGYITATELNNAGRDLLKVNNHMGRLQADATMHLANYIVSGNVRDLQQFRTTSSPVLEIAEVRREWDRPGVDRKQLTSAYKFVGLTDFEISRLHHLNTFNAVFPISYRGPEIWDHTLNHHFRLLDIARKVLRDHVHGRMTEVSSREYIRELRMLNLEVLEEHEAFEIKLSRSVSQINLVMMWIFPGILLFGGGFIGYLALHLERNWKHHETILYRSRSRYQEMFEQAGIGIVQTAPDGRLLWANPAMARILGYESVEELFMYLGNFERKFIDPERKSDFKYGLKEEGSVTNFMFRAKRRDDRPIWLLCNARAVRDQKGDLICYEGSYQDYTLYRQTNQELHYLTTILRGMAQSIYQLLLSTDFDKAVNDLLKIMGMASGVDRTYIFRNYESATGRYSDMEYEWVKYKTLGTINEKINKHLQMSKIDKEVDDKLAKGEVLQLITKEVDPAFQTLLKKQKTRALILAPIMVNGDYWGFIGHDNCSNDDKWPNEVNQIMKTIASALGNFIMKGHVERSLMESKNRYHTLVGNIREIVYQTGEDGTIQYLNPAWEKITEYSVKESLGRKIMEFIHKEDRDEARRVYGEIAKKKESNIKKEFRLVTKKGAIRWLDWTCLVMTGTETVAPHVYGTMYDLTERKKAEFTMMQNTQRLEALIENSPLVITSMDTNGIVTLWNKTAENTFGWKREEVIGKTVPDVKGQNEQEHLELLDRVLSGQFLKGVELERVRKDGTDIQISLSAAPLFNNEGKVVQVITFSQDITEAKISREAIRKSLKEKNVLLSEIHHRVKNNMAVISGLLSLKAQEQTDPKVASLLRESENRIRSMAMIHEKLYQSETFAEVEFGSYLKELTLYIEGHYDKSEVPIDTQIHASEIILEITQAVPCGLLVNELITNGYKHAFQGREQGKIVISCTIADGYCELHYKDDGIGLPEKVLTDAGAASLGMNLIRGLSQQLKGELKMANNNGASIRLRFKLL